MTKLLVYAPAPDFRNEPAFRIRLANLREAMRRRGFQWDFQPRPKSPWGRLALAQAARHYDGVILHRKLLDGYEARALRRSLPRPGRIFLDIDDVTMIHETALGGIARRRLARRFEATMKILDVACAGNDHLAEVFQKRGIKTTVIPSVVDPAAYPVKQARATDSPALVWIGSASTRKYLEESFPALERAAARVAHLRLVVICDAAPAAAPLPLEFIPWSLEGEAAALLRGDIGIAPTPENPWTLGKSGFKIVQYLAAGLPVIASPVGFNARLVRPGPPAAWAGLLPVEWGEWAGAIEELAGDVGLRARYGAAGRGRIEGELCVEQAADLWARALG